MQLAGKVAVVTGGGGGIGRALCNRFHAEGARAVVAADLNGEAAQQTARAIGGMAVTCDVTREDDILRLIDTVETAFGPIDLFCSNAGILPVDPDPGNVAGAPDAVWQRAFGVNVMAHIYAARHLAPRMKARGGGYFLHTLSAAGLLSQVNSAPYATTKHAAVGFAECLAIYHHDDNIKVSILCPQGVETDMLRGMEGGSQGVDGLLTADQVADAAIAGLATEQFLILPHPQVAKYVQNKTADYDRWLRGMARLRAQTG